MKLFVFDKYSIIILALILVFTACMIPIGMVRRGFHSRKNNERGSHLRGENGREKNCCYL